MVRYNHYNKSYDVVDGRLNWEHVDDQYAISFVFKGNWTCHLSCEATSEKILPDDGALRKEMRKDPDGFDPDEEEEKWCGFFSGLTVVDSDGNPKEYRLEVQEDAVWEAAQGPKKTYKAEESVIQKGPKMESCSCIEGNPCADAYCCKDWKNRFEIAKKNGWKGYGTHCCLRARLLACYQLPLPPVCAVLCDRCVVDRREPDVSFGFEIFRSGSR